MVQEIKTIYGNRLVAILIILLTWIACSGYGGTLDFAFIDADHSYEACKEDLELWAPKVRAGGIVAGHDYGAIWPGVVEAVHEYVANNGLKLHLGTDSLWWFQKPT